MKSVAMLGATALALVLAGGAAMAADMPIMDDPMIAVSEPGGFYMSLHGGLYMPENPDVTFGSGLNNVANVRVDNGYRLGGALGYDFNSNFAGELEVSYVSSDIDSFYYFGEIPANGYGSALTLMANAIVGTHYGAFHLYAGVGAGVALVHMKADFASGLDDSDVTYAAQLLAGVEYDLADNISLGARYRYQYIGETNYTDGISNPVVLSEIGGHSVEATLKFRF